MLSRSHCCELLLRSLLLLIKSGSKAPAELSANPSLRLTISQALLWPPVWHCFSCMLAYLFSHNKHLLCTSIEMHVNVSMNLTILSKVVMKGFPEEAALELKWEKRIRACSVGKGFSEPKGWNWKYTVHADTVKSFVSLRESLCGVEAGVCTFPQGGMKE